MPAPQVEDSVFADALPEGTTYVRRLGIGGQRLVHLVESAGEPRVLKLMNEDARERAEREVAAGQLFHHSGVVTIRSDLAEIEIESKTYLYFLEDLIEGDSLDRIGTLEDCQVLRMGIELIAAAEYLYEEHNLVHRDIKPANIMCRPDGGFVLLDVGIGRHLDLDTLTAMNAPHGPGTPGYLAPEQLVASKGHEMDSRADQFSIGVVMFESLSGRLPFDPKGGSYRTLLATGTIGSWEGVSQGLRPLLERMLQPKAHRRFRAGRTQEAIEQVREAQGCS
jgi:eukaryotic-like serine/threonine-protein kinase